MQSWGAWGPISGGTQITISGKNLNYITAVDFGGTPGVDAGTNLSINATGTQLTVDSPAEAAGPEDIILWSLGYNLGPNTGSYDTGFQFYFEGTPSVTHVSPATLNGAGGTPLTITGTSLYPVSSVYLVNKGDPNVRAQAVVNTQYPQSPTQVTVTAPGGLVQSGYYEYVEVTTAVATSVGNSNNLVNFANNPPLLTGISPNTGAASGASVTLTGSNFTGVYAVFFVGNDLDEEVTHFTLNTSSNPQTITCTSPILYPGIYSVTVSNGGAGSNPVSFTTTPSAYITGVSPSSGYIDPGTLVTITGVNIQPFEDVINFGGIALTPLPGYTNSEVQVISPSPLPSSYIGQVANIQIMTNYGETPITPADEFTYAAPMPNVTSLSQTSGSVGGGTTLTITGTFLDDATAVSFGGVSGTIVPDTSTDTSLEVISPASAGYDPGTVDVTVTGEYGTTPVSTGDKFTYVARGPVVSGLSPASVLVNTQTAVTISGSDLANASEVYFGSPSAGRRSRAILTTRSWSSVRHRACRVRSTCGL